MLETWIEPGFPVEPILEPNAGKIVPMEFMPFPQKVREWALRVTHGKCITPIYDERTGWKICGKPAEEVDHLEPESVVLYNGGDPNNDSTPIPRCRDHHTSEGTTFDEDGETYIAPFGTEDWSRHPDIGAALEEYRKGDKNAFKKAIQKHRESIQRGERFWNEDEGSEKYEKELFERLADKYGEPRPQVKPHKNARDKHWTDGWFQSHPRDDTVD